MSSPEQTVLRKVLVVRKWLIKKQFAATVIGASFQTQVSTNITNRWNGPDQPRKSTFKVHTQVQPVLRRYTYTLYNRWLILRYCSSFVVSYRSAGPVLPKLKISDVTSIDGKYLVVNGKIHSYKIHIGSGNVLIMPANKYLCIVPASRNTKVRIYLPFAGDLGLSIILSRAFMLAEDDKIEDASIIVQLQS